MSSFLSTRGFALAIMVAAISTVSNLYAATVTINDAYMHSFSASGNNAVDTSHAFTEITTPFDPSLGTLNGIDITFSGTTSYDITAGQHYEFAFVPVYIPYQIVPDLNFSISGVNGFYSYASPALQIFTSAVQVPGEGGSLDTVTAGYSFSYRYDALLDQFAAPTNVNSSGVAVTVPPSFMSGDLNGFIDNPFLSNGLSFSYDFGFSEMVLVQFTTETSINVTNNLNIETTYSYTPWSVPIPGAVWLLGSGLIGLFGFAGHRKI